MDDTPRMRSFAHEMVIEDHPNVEATITAMGGWREVSRILAKEIFFSRFLIAEREEEHHVRPTPGEAPGTFYRRRFPILLESYRGIGVPPVEAILTAAVEVELLFGTRERTASPFGCRCMPPASVASPRHPGSGPPREEREGT